MTVYTENLGDFGSREREMLAELLTCENNWPDAFEREGVKGAMNMNSGYVFLVNDDCQVLMMNGDDPELFHSTPYEGHEGFLSDLMEEHKPSDLNQDDIDYIVSCAKNENIFLDGSWEEIEED